MTQVYRIGLLGASRIARGAIFAPLRDDPRFVVSSVGARDSERARAYAEKYAIPAVADDYAALISRDDVDIVYNALPPAGHAQWTIAALQAGKPVLCEKPFARNAAEAEAMVAASRAAGLPLLEAFHYRFHTVIRQAEDMVRQGALGALHTGAAEFNLSIPRSPGELRWSREQGGGAMMDLGCYPLHAMRTLTGMEPEVVSAQAVFDNEGDGADAAMRAELVFPGGVSVSIACSMISENREIWLRLDGERGRLEITNFVAPQIGCRFVTTIDGESVEHPTDGRTSYAAQLDHLYEVMTGAAQPMTGGFDAIDTMTAIDAIHGAARR